MTAWHYIAIGMLGGFIIAFALDRAIDLMDRHGAIPANWYTVIARMMSIAIFAGGVLVGVALTLIGLSVAS